MSLSLISILQSLKITMIRIRSKLQMTIAIVQLYVMEAPRTWSALAMHLLEKLQMQNKNPCDAQKQKQKLCLFIIWNK